MFNLMNAAESCVLVMELAAKALNYGNTNTASGVAAVGRTACAWDTMYNAGINLAAIKKDEDFNSAMRSRVKAALGRAEGFLSTLTALAGKKMLLS
jgi:formiminotetrahydrofolate cyclodeaminase